MFAALQNQKTRNKAVQIAFVGGLLIVLVSFFLTARHNLEALGITSGFDFLFRSTGWDIGFSLLSYTPNDPYWRVLLIGFTNTLFLGLIGLVLATIIGVAVGMARTSENGLLNLLGATYVEIFRNIPLIVQVFFWYALATRLPGPRQAYSLGESVFLSSRGVYLPGLNVSGGSAFLAITALLVAIGLIVWISSARRFARMDVAPKFRLRLAVLGVSAVLAIVIFWAGRLPETDLISVPAMKGLNFKGGIRISPEMSALGFAMAVYGGSYIGEIVRGGFKSVGRGQVEAAKSVGLTPWQVFSRVRFPLALRAMLPALTNQYVWLIKATTMGIAIGFTDFFMIISISINQSGQTIELIGILMGGFLAINFTLAAILNWLNRAIALKGSQLRS